MYLRKHFGFTARVHSDDLNEILDGLNYDIHGIEDDNISLKELMTCAPYQKLLIYKHNLDSQAEREGARVTEENAATKERTEDAQVMLR